MALSAYMQVRLRSAHLAKQPSPLATQDREYVLHRRRVARTESRVAHVNMTPLARASQ